MAEISRQSADAATPQSQQPQRIYVIRGSGSSEVNERGCSPH
eukprot:gene31719-63277_t